MIHKYYLGGLYIVLDVNSGGVHIVDAMTYDLLDYAQPPFADECPDTILAALGDKYDAAELQACYAELRELYEQKILFSEDDYEKYAKFAVAAPIKAMCLHISHDCNLRCKYCFASTGDFGTGRKLMPVETATALVLPADVVPPVTLAVWSG